MKWRLFLVSIGIAGVLLALGCSNSQGSQGQSDEFKQAVLAGPQLATGADPSLSPATSDVEDVGTTQASLPGVGAVTSGDSYDIAVAGGKFIKIGKTKYVALKIYVLSDGLDMMDIESDMEVEDEFGESHENSDMALQKAHLQPLDTLSYVLEEGESTGGWVAFKVSPKAKILTLNVGGISDVSDSAPISIALAGFQDVPAGSDVAKMYAKAAKTGGARADAAELTMSEYKQVKHGMSLKQVNKIVGFKGDELSRYGSYAAYSWQNEDGSNMMVSFHGNREYSKAQAGL